MIFDKSMKWWVWATNHHWFDNYGGQSPPAVNVLRHQWYKLTRRSDKLLTVGNRVRGDVLV